MNENKITVQITGDSLRDVAMKMLEFIDKIKGFQFFGGIPQEAPVDTPESPVQEAENNDNAGND